jgi:hypothetical protein
VAASTDHFADEGAVYRRAIGGAGPMERISNFPERLEGIVDTGCIAARGLGIAVADKGGNLYISADAGRSWLQRERGLPPIGCILLV